LSPPLAPVPERYMEEIRQLSDDDDDELELPALERMISETRPDYDSQKKTQEPVSNDSRSSFAVLTSREGAPPLLHKYTSQI
jgi:hypothetical protein